LSRGFGVLCQKQSKSADHSIGTLHAYAALVPMFQDMKVVWAEHVSPYLQTPANAMEIATAKKIPDMNPAENTSRTLMKRYFQKMQHSTRIYNKLIDGDGCGQSSQFHVAMACLNPHIHYQWLESAGELVVIDDNREASKGRSKRRK
jgi:hypothetical protein